MNKRSVTRRIIRIGLAVLLLPVCVGTFRALLKVIDHTRQAESVWVGLLAGAACWGVIYLLLPKPGWLYVFGHELTHAVWTWAFGGKVKKFKVTSRKGHVVVSRTNFLILLAPYFFPMYAALVAASFFVLRLLLDWRIPTVWFHLLMGASYAFHVTLTSHTLKTRQPDLDESGYLFSAVVIWLGNMGVLLLSIPLVTGSMSVITAGTWCWIETGKVVRLLWNWN